ncbi:MAG: uracil-DNA glycosylase family protein [Candidatus Methylomirabilis sp.]
MKNHDGEYVFVDVTVTHVEHRRAGRNFPLYNIGVEEDESFVVAGLISHNCRPPGNRNPESDEIASCEPFLIGQLQAIKPKLICALGNFAAQILLRTKEPISKLRGRFHSYQGIPVLPTFHPAYLLRNPHEKKTVWEDMKLLQREYEKLTRTK